MIEISDKSFDREISENSTIVVDFWAPWCDPCKSLAPILDKVSESTGVIFGKVNIDDSKEVLKRFGIRSIPTLILFQNGSVVAKHTGFINEIDLTQWLKDNGSI